MILAVSLTLLQADLYTQSLLEKLLSPLFQEKPIVAYVDAEHYQTLQDSKLFRLQSACDSKTELVLWDCLEHLPDACRNKPLFATTYRTYINHPDNAFGAFYWRKGRPQIHFNKRLLEKYHLTLPPTLQRFIDE